MRESEDRDQGSGIRDQGSGIRDQGSGIRDQGSGIRGQCHLRYLIPDPCLLTPAPATIRPRWQVQHGRSPSPWENPDFRWWEQLQRLAQPNGLRVDRRGIGLTTGPGVPRVVRTKPPGVLVTSRREEYDLSARGHLTLLAATAFGDRVDRMVQRELAR